MWFKLFFFKLSPFEFNIEQTSSGHYRDTIGKSRTIILIIKNTAMRVLFQDFCVIACLVFIPIEYLENVDPILYFNIT